MASGNRDRVRRHGFVDWDRGAYVAVMALATLGFWCWHRAQPSPDVRDA